jgi:HAE1 family hydrophobic/amphiphilic exporter-1
MEVLPSLQNDLATLDQIFLKATTGGEVPLSTFAKWTTTPAQPLGDQPSGPVSGDDYQLQSGSWRGA